MGGEGLKSRYRRLSRNPLMELTKEIGNRRSQWATDRSSPMIVVGKVLAYRSLRLLGLPPY
jgi:hypothetical protein